MKKLNKKLELNKKVIANLGNVKGGKDFSDICPTWATCTPDTIQNPTWIIVKTDKGVPTCETNWTSDYTCTPSNQEGYTTCHISESNIGGCNC